MLPYQPDRHQDCELPDAVPLCGGPLDGVIIDTRPDRVKVFCGRPFRLGWHVRNEFGVWVTCICTISLRRAASYCWRGGKMEYVP
jgi:hypothetical protein